MSRDPRSEPDRLDLHAVLLVVGALLAAALTKGGYPLWGIGIALVLYSLSGMANRLLPVIARRPWAGIAEGRSAN